MENTIEEKAKFFAQYWGQGILTDGVQEHNISSVMNLKHESFYIKLKPLSSITDEDAIKVARILNYGFNDELAIIYSKDFVKNVIDINVYQYLQSKGYALPFMGLSVEKLIEYGWIKLAENGKK